jgi:hypothetical protein
MFVKEGNAGTSGSREKNILLFSLFLCGNKSTFMYLMLFLVIGENREIRQIWKSKGRKRRKAEKGRGKKRRAEKG